MDPTQPQFPNPIAMVVGEVLGEYYFHHSTLNTLFMEAGAPGDAPPETCVVKSQEWLKRTATTPGLDALNVLGKVLRKFMDQPDRYKIDYEEQRKRVLDILARHGLTYHPGGTVLGERTAAPTRSLESLLRAHDFAAVSAEFDRAIKQVDTDPPGAITAACAIVESLCKIIIADENLTMPAKQDIGHVWSPVKQFLRLDPSVADDEDIRTLFGAMGAIISGVGALRTHEGSAHGRGREGSGVEPRHARLAIHAAHTLVAFVLESWRPGAR